MSQLIVTIHCRIERINVRYIWVSGKNRPLSLVLIVILELIHFDIIRRTYTCSIVAPTKNVKGYHLVLLPNWRAYFQRTHGGPRHLLGVSTTSYHNKDSIDFYLSRQLCMQDTSLFSHSRSVSDHSSLGPMLWCQICFYRVNIIPYKNLRTSVTYT